MKFNSVLNPFIIIPVFGLMSIGLSIISSSSSELFIPQLIFFLIGSLIFILFSSIDFRIWSKFIWFIYFVSLLFISISYLGPIVRGANRWIDIFGIRLQPSEITKPFLIIVLAYFVSRARFTKLSTQFINIILLFPIVLLIFKQPDLGNTLVYLFVFATVEIMGGIPWKYIFIRLLIFLAFIPILWYLLQSYQKERVLSFLNPQLDPVGAGYNALQAKITLGSGRIYGLGLGRGTQSRLLFLPEYHTDFVFAALGEELGFIGSAIVIVFYFILLYKILHIGYQSDNVFGRLLAIGIFSQFFIQIFINIGMNLGLLPITGITLPLISYGGSSIISSFIGLGIIVSIAKTNKINNPLVIR